MSRKPTETCLLNRTTKVQPRANRLLLLAFACLFLLVQSTALLHHHDDDLQPRLDCHLCLKLGASDDFLPVALLTDFADRVSVLVPHAERDAISASRPDPRSRSPPQFLI